MSLEAFPQSRLAAIIESDLFYKFRTSWITVGAFVVTLVIVLAAVLAPWIAPHDPFDVSTLSLWDSELPPVWAEGGDPKEIVESRGMKQVTDIGAIEAVVDQIIAANPAQVEKARANPKLAGWFVGQVLKASGGKANPAAVNQLVAKKLQL